MSRDDAKNLSFSVLPLCFHFSIQAFFVISVWSDQKFKSDKYKKRETGYDTFLPDKPEGKYRILPLIISFIFLLFVITHFIVHFSNLLIYEIIKNEMHIIFTSRSANCDRQKACFLGPIGQHIDQAACFSCLNTASRYSSFT